MAFEVTILGSGAALPTSLRNPTAQFVDCCNRNILIDCGEGTQNQLRLRGIKIQKITHILISHLHGDHFFGLVGLLSTMHLLGRTKGITVYGPTGLEQIIRMQLEIGGAKLDFSIDFIELFGNETRIIYEDRKIEILTFPLRHRIPANGFKISEKPHERTLDGEKFKAQGLSLTLIPKFKAGENVTLEDGTVLFAEDYTFPPAKSKSYAYCSDTTYLESLVPAIAGADLLYHEATFLKNMAARAKTTLHSTAEDAAKIAKLANVGKLILGHLSARYSGTEAHFEEASAIFPNVQVVEDGDVYKI